MIGHFGSYGHLGISGGPNPIPPIPIAGGYPMGPGGVPGAGGVPVVVAAPTIGGTAIPFAPSATAPTPAVSTVTEARWDPSQHWSEQMHVQVMPEPLSLDEISARQRADQISAALAQLQRQRGQKPQGPSTGYVAGGLLVLLLLGGAAFALGRAT